MNRRRWLASGCARCALVALPWAAGSARADNLWATPPRFARPDPGSDEGGLWALMDREESQVRRSPFRIRDDGLQDYLQALVCKLGASHCLDVRVYPVRSPFFNASMAPNGMMVVWSGLLLRVDNEAQLCAVLAHELGHYLQRHTLQQLRDAKARSAFGIFMIGFGLAGALASLVAVASRFAFTRDQEREADRIGLQLIEQAGYDPREAAKVWDNLVAELAANPRVDPAKANPMFATHPPSIERSQDLARLAEGRSGALGRDDYQRRLAPLRQQLLADELKRGQFEESLALLDRLIASNGPQADLLYFRGETRRLRAAAGDAEAALADLQAAVASGGEPAATHRSLGYLHRSLQHRDEARASFRRYLQQEPAAVDAALIQHYLDEGNPA